MKNRIDKQITEVRAFNRFYTDILGLLDRHIYNSKYSHAEVRIMYELYHNDNLTAKGLQNILHIDKGYLSRILAKFEHKKLLKRTISETDRREVNLTLTTAGKSQFEVLNQVSQQQVGNMLKPLDIIQSENLITHMKEIQKLLHCTVNGEEHV